MSVRDVCRIGVAALLCMTSGCTGPAQKVEKVYNVTGTVQIDGRPLVNGMVSFMPADGRGGSSATIVTDGAFQCAVAAGAKAVRIEDMQKGRSYGNEASPLTADVKPNAENRFEFNVKSGGK
ncbi:MAG: hypothetical protein ACKOEX_14530 [Planctomycetia bacterium]